MTLKHDKKITNKISLLVTKKIILINIVFREQKLTHYKQH